MSITTAHTEAPVPPLLRVTQDQERAHRWLASARRVPAAWRVLKRAVDLVAGSLLLLVCLPLCLLIALAIALVSPGPIFFVQERVGLGGRRFRMYKFRTMVDGAHLLHHDLAHLSDTDGPALKIANDPRVHPLGAFLRRNSLDELPQLWNVVRGEMSLVGPRPALPCEVADYQPHYFRRLCVPPGMTGLWQVSGRANVPFRRWMAMDVWYADHWSPALDAWILLRTPVAVVRREGAW
jgi:lipopolysaccharide/colanic/teichoic acid biosynthesis glycosyltransferase